MDVERGIAYIIGARGARWWMWNAASPTLSGRVVVAAPPLAASHTTTFKWPFMAAVQSGDHPSAFEPSAFHMVPAPTRFWTNSRLPA